MKTLKENQASLLASADRKAKRKSNAAFQRKVSGRPRLPSIKTLKDKLWDLNTLVVRRRDGPVCRICKVQPGYAQYHLIPVCEAPGLKYDLANIAWGCRSCNCDEVNHRASYARRHQEIFGALYMEELWKRAQVPVQLRRGELNQMIADRTAVLEKA